MSYHNDVYNDLLDWRLDLWVSGDRIKASKILRIQERLSLRRFNYLRKGKR
jgi:hypothetical protein